MNKFKLTSYLKKLNIYMNENSMLLLARFALFLSGVTGLLSLISVAPTSFQWILKESQNTSLGIIIESLINNWKLCILISFIITNTFICLLAVITSITNIINPSLYLKILFFSYSGVFPIIFVFVLLLSSTKPSDATIIFSTLSAIGASIVFCYSIFKTYRGN